MTIGDRIKSLRTSLNLTQIELANAVGVSKQTLYKYENNIISNIPSNCIEDIAKVLKTSPAYLMGWDDSDDEPSYYTNPETAKLAQEAFDDPDTRILLDAKKDLDPDDLRMVIDMVKRLKGDND